jgi:hypothetical protein
MTYYKHKDKLKIDPDLPKEMKWFTTSILVISGSSFIISAIGAFNYLFGDPSEELLLLTSGSLILGLTLWFLSLSEGIQKRMQNILLNTPEIIEFTENKIVFKEYQIDTPKKAIPSTDLESIHIDVEKEIQSYISSKTIPRLSYPTYRKMASDVIRKVHRFTKIKSIIMILKFKKGQKEIINLGEYSDNISSQKNILKAIMDYCHNKYEGVDLPENSEIELLDSKPHIETQ